jgi:hypothetical protein
MNQVANTRSKRLSVVGDKLIALSAQTLGKLGNLDDELRYLKKLDITDGNISCIFEHKKNLLMRQVDLKRTQLETLSKEVDNANLQNIELKNKLIELETQFTHLNLEFKKCSEMKQKYHSDIIKIRRENTKEFDNKLNTLNKQDKKLKQHKKELFLLINILKLRVVNLDSLAEDKFVKGYLIDMEKNTIKYIEINRNQEAINNCIIYWSAMKELLIGKGQLQSTTNTNINMNKENKENFAITNKNK